MNIDQLREVEKESFAYLGNHSHMHEYMVTFEFNKFTNDIDRSIEIFNNLFNYNQFFPIHLVNIALSKKIIFHPNLSMHLDNILVLLI